MNSFQRILLILVAVVIASMSAGIARPAIAFLVRYGLGATVLATASLTSGFMAGRAVSSSVAGFIGDIAPSRRGLIAGLAVIGVGFSISIIPMLGSFGLILVLMALWGAFSGLAWPTAQVMVSELGGDRSGTVLSIYFALGSLGISLGNFIFGQLNLPMAELARIAGVFLVIAGTILLSALSGVHVRRKPKNAKEIMVKILNPIVLWILGSAFIIGLLSGVLKEYFYIYSYESFGLEKSDLGNLLALGGVASVFFGLFAGWASDKLGIPVVLLLVLGLAATGSLVLGAESAGILGLYTGYILASSGVRASMPLTRNASIVRGTGGSTVVGFSNTLSNLGTMTGPLVAGFLYERVGGGSPYLMAGLLILGVMIIYAFIAHSRSG